MKNKSPEDDLHYAMFTHQAGCRPFHGVLLVLENAVENFAKISSHPDGAPSHTYDTVAKNAISDIAIVMAYSLLEGFFHVEFDYYFKGRRVMTSPVGIINEFIHVHGVKLKDWRSQRKLIAAVRKLRNAVAHQNGITSEKLEKSESEELFGEDVFEDRSYPRLSPHGSARIVRIFQGIAEEYAEQMFEKMTRKTLLMQPPS